MIKKNGQRTSLILILLLVVLALQACSGASPVTASPTTAAATAATSAATTAATTTAASTTAAATTAATEASATTAATTKKTLPGEMSWKDLAAEINGVTYTAFDEAAELLAGLGKPVFFSEAPSCLFEGTDKTYEYNDVVIYTIPKDGGELIDGIDLVSGKYKTSRGITVGSTRAEVIAAYGDPFSADIDLVYITDQSLGDASARITIVFDGDTVSMVSIYSGSNSAA